MQYSLGHDCSIVLEQIDQIVLICRDNSVNFVGFSLKLGLPFSNLLQKNLQKKWRNYLEGFDGESERDSYKSKGFLII